MPKINIFFEGSYLHLNGQEKTLKEIKETLFSSYGYSPEKIFFYTDKNFKNFIPDDLINLSAMENLNLYIKYIKENDENKFNNSLNSSSSECSSDDFYPKDLRNVFEKLNEKFDNEKKLLNKKRNCENFNENFVFIHNKNNNNNKNDNNNFYENLLKNNEKKENFE
jgi:hypothetical protein